MDKDIYIDIRGDYPSGIIEAKRIKNTEYSRILVQFYNSSHGDNAKIDLFINGVSDEVGKTIQWKIKSLNTGEYFDIDDYTTGKNAELIIEKIYAGCSHNDFRGISPTGSKEEQELYKKYNKPQKFLVEAHTLNNNITLSTQIWVFSNIEVKGNDNWIGIDYKPVTSLTEKRYIAISVKEVYGLYKRNCIVRIFNEKNRIVQELNIEVVNAEILIELSTSFDFPDGKYRYSLFHTEFGDEVEFFKGNKWIEASNLKKKGANFSIVPVAGIISEVVIKEEEFFTQRYESCKYESITMEVPNGETIVLFDEKNSDKRKINPDRSWFYFLGQNEDKPLVIKAVNLKIKECKYQTISSEDSNSNQISHQNPFDVASLEEDKMKYSLEDNKLVLFLNYPYTYEQLGVKKILKNSNVLGTQDYVDFFINYNPLSVKSVESSFSINTCRYHMKPTFSIVPDINWVIHVMLFAPDNNHLSDRFEKSKLYYRNYSELNFESNSIETIKSFIDDYSNFILKIWGLVDVEQFFYIKGIKNVLQALQEMLSNVITDYLKSMISDFKIGMHACYDYNSQGKPTSIIDYGKQFDYIRVFYILSLACIQIGIEIIILILSRGALADKILKSEAKLNSIRKVLDSKGDFESVMSELGIEVLYAQIGMYLGGGYQNSSKDEIKNIVTYRIVAEPLLGFKIKDEITPGLIVKDFSGIGPAFSALRLVGVDKLLGKLKKSSRLSKIVNSSIDYIESSDFSQGLVKLEGEIVRYIDSAISKVLGVDTKITMNANIFYELFAEIKIDIEKETIEPIDNQYIDFSNNIITYGPRRTMSIRFEFDATVKNRVMMGLINIYTLNKKEAVEMRGEIEMGMIFERAYSYETLKDFQKSILTQGITLIDLKQEKQLVYQDTFTFTGAYGYFDAEFISLSEGGDDLVTNKDEFKKDKKPFEIFPPFTKVLNKQGALPDKLKKII